MAKKPEAVFTSLWGGHFVTFAKQAKAAALLRGGEEQLRRPRARPARPETAKAMGDDYPVGIWAQRL